MREIKLTKDKVALVDDENFEMLNRFRWYASEESQTFYAKTDQGGRKNRVRHRMHRFIMKAEKGQFVDHIDGNGLNNQRANLRFCTKQQNNMNKQKRNNCSSSYKGVSYYKSRKKWEANIQINGKNTRLGYFRTAVEAAKAYNKKALLIFGEFAKLNVIREE